MKATVPRPRTIRFVAVAAVGLAAMLLLVLQFVPWHAWDLETGGGFMQQQPTQIEGTAGLWGLHETYNNMGHTVRGWFDDGWGERDGIGMLRAGAILGVLALVAAFAATVLLGLDLRWWGAGAATAAAALAIVTTALVAQGTMRFANIHVDRSIGFFLAIATCFLLFVGALLSYLPSPRLGLRESVASWGNEADATQ